MPGISVHAVDVSRGLPAAGLRVEIYALAPERHRLADGLLGANGALDHAITRQSLVPGPYEVLFHLGPWYAAGSTAPATPAFLDVVPFRFTIGDAHQHYHLPLKFTPWGYSLWRGS